MDQRQATKWLVADLHQPATQLRLGIISICKTVNHSPMISVNNF
jgi:hypothetical protein